MSVHLGDSHDFSFLDKVRSQLNETSPLVPFAERIMYALASWEDFQRPAYHYETYRGNRLRSQEKIFAVSKYGECRLLIVPSLNLAPSTKVWQEEGGRDLDRLRVAIAKEREIEEMFNTCFGAGEFLDSFECFMTKLKDVRGFPRPHDFWLGSVDRQLTADDRFIVHCELQEINIRYVSVSQWVINLREILPNFRRQRRLSHIRRTWLPELEEGEDTRTN